MSGREPSFAEFEPERLAPRRRRIDPVVVGSIVVVLGIVAAILKPWAAPTDDAEASTSPSASGAIAAASPASTGIVSGPLPAVTGDVETGWPAVSAVVRPHEAWGIRAIVPLADTGTSGPLIARPPRMEEVWVPANREASGVYGPGDPDVGDAGRWRAQPIDANQGVLALGLTFPPDELPLDARVLQQTEAGWTWVPTAPLDASPAAGAFLWPPPVIGGVRPVTWPGGSYRIEILTATTVRQLDVDVLGRLEVVPDPAVVSSAPPTPDLVSPFAPDLVDSAGGLFIVDGGIARELPATVGPALDAAAAWRDTAHPEPIGPDRVSVVYAPKANGLGFLFAAGDGEVTADLVRLLPSDALTGARRVAGVRFVADQRQPYVIFRAPDDRPWAPGLYRLDVGWHDDHGTHRAAVHVELRPDRPAGEPTILGSLASLATVAGQDAAVGIIGPVGGLFGLACPGPGQSAVLSDPPVLIGLGHLPGRPPASIRADVLLDGIQRVEQPLLLAREPVDGLTILATPNGVPFLASRYRLTVDDGIATRVSTICPGMTVGG